MDLFRKKSVDQLVAESTPLKRTMRTFDLTMLGIGAIIGTGIFVLTGKGALTAGPALSVSFLLAAVCCGFAGLCYAEFAAMAPVSGSAYSYAYLAFGELIAFVIGWDLILEYALQAATVSAGWSGYFNKLLEGFGLHLPVELTAAYGTNPDVTTYFNLPGFVIVLIITWVLSIGINQTKRTNDVMVLIKLAIIVLFIVCAVWYVKPSNWQPFSPYGIYTFQPGSTQPYGIVPAASIVFFSFIGFDAVSSSAEETINPNKTLPRGILISLAVSTVLYIVMAAQFVNLLYNIVDRIYIGHIPEIGTNALAGVGVTTSIVILISSFSAIVGAGGAPLAAMALGQGDRVRAGKFLGNGFMLLILFTVLTSLVSYLFMEPILRFAGASAVTLPYAEDYLSVYLLGTLFVEISTGLNTFINSQGRPNIAMYSVLIGALLNIVLDPIFIFWFDMGVKGAALATILSQACSAWWVLGFLCSDRASLRLQKCYLKFDCRIVGGMLALGVSPFIMASTESLVGFVLNGSLEKFGDIYVGALAILQSAMQLVSVPLTGFAQGFVPVASYNYGHGDRQRVKDCFRIVLMVMFSFNFVLMFSMSEHCQHT